jgi:hypothetical protein
MHCCAPYLWVISDRAPDPILHNTAFMRKVHTNKRVPILPYLSKYEKIQKGTILPIFKYEKPVCGSGSDTDPDPAFQVNPDPDTDPIPDPDMDPGF